jgi:hypothetical protein
MPEWTSTLFVNGEMRLPNGDVSTKLPTGTGQMEGTSLVNSSCAIAKLANSSASVSRALLSVRRLSP